MLRPTRLIRLLIPISAAFTLVGLAVAPARAAVSLTASPVRSLGTGWASAGVPGPVVLVGTAGVRWDDVTASSTPTLNSLGDHEAIGVLAVRSVRRSACSADGWLAVSAGQRAGDAATSGTEPSCRALAPAAPDGQVPGWATYVQQARDGSFGATPGLLGDRLRRAGVPAAAVGPGAAIALADRAGAVSGTSTASPGSADPAALAGQVGAAVGAGARLVLVDAGSVRDPADLPATDPPAPSRASQVEAVDARIGAVLATLPGNATVLVISLADSGNTPHLQLIAAKGPAGANRPPFGPALLQSSSTRQLGIAQTTDVAPTLLGLLGVGVPAAMVGSPIHVEPPHGATTLLAPEDTAAQRRAVVIDLDRAALAVQPLVPLFFGGLVVAQVLLYGLAAVALRRNWGGPARRRRMLAVLRRLAVVFAAVPVSTYLANLVPWWHLTNTLLAVIGATALPVLVISAVALLGPWRRRLLGPMGAVGAASALVLAVDATTGSRLQISSLMGEQPVVAGRWYGFGNVTFAVFATGALLLATALADSLVRRDRLRAAVLVVAVIGAFAVVIDGLPRFGSDFGGPIALIPAFAVLALRVAGVRLTWRRLLAVGGATILVIAVISVLDWLRPPGDRTHLGRFVSTVIDGGAWQVLQRKEAQNLSILFSSTLTLLLPVAALFVVLILMRPNAFGAPALGRAYARAPVLRPGLLSFLVMMGIGFATNDSGTAIPAVGATVAIPLLIAVGARALEDDQPAAAPATPPGPAPHARPTPESRAEPAVPATEQPSAESRG